MSDVTAFNNCMSALWRQHEAELSRFLTSKTGDSEKAADLLQELFLRARAHSDSFCEMENPRAWLYRAARNLLIDEYRTTREFVELEEDAPFTEASPDAISTLDICLPETLQALQGYTFFRMARTTLFSQESYQLQHQGNVGPITLEASFLLNREQFGMGHSLEMKGQFIWNNGKA